MKTNRSDNYTWQLLLGAFFVSGVLHVALYGVPFTDGIVQIFDGTVILCWLAALMRRIMDRYMRRFLVTIAALMIGYFALQMCKYKLFADVTALRYVWYCFYIPMSLIPLLLFFVALCMNQQEGTLFDRKWFLLCVPAVLLMAGVLTNDLHFLAFRFPDGLVVETGYAGTYTYGPLYMLVIVWEALLVVVSLVLILKKCEIVVFWRNSLLPSGTLLAGTALMLLGVFGLSPKDNGVTVWQLAETYIFTMVLFLEACIQIGMIPTNTGYERIFGLLRMPAAICDESGEKVITSGCALPEVTGEDIRIETMDIYGGRAAWSVDLTEINALNSKIADVTEQIEIRNEHLLSEKLMKEEQAALDARNALYDRIALIVRPQLDQVDAILRMELAQDFDAAIAKINVLNAYIKRRSNMELLKADTGRLYVSELIMSVRESMECLQDTGVGGSVSAVARHELPAELLIFAYELFERVLESCLGSAKIASVFLNCQNHALRIRLMIEDRDEGIDSEKIPLFDERYQALHCGYCGSVQEERQERERVVTITFLEGGIS